MADKIQKTEAEWREQLTPEEYQVTRQKGTERPMIAVQVSSWRSAVFHAAMQPQSWPIKVNSS